MTEEEPSLEPVVRSDSTMRTLGISVFTFGTTFSFIFWAISFVGDADSQDRLTVQNIAWWFGGIAGLGAFMWILGIVEQRLIEIRNLLSKRAG